nr:unnamed protein product [Digitaria exilis]
MGCVFGRAAASSSPAAPRRKRGKERASPQPDAAEAAEAVSPSAAGGDGRPRRRLGGRRAAGPRQGCVPASAAAEQLAAGWPPWLVAVAGEALRGWAPRRADTFEKLNKIGSGTYSNVYRARDTVSGRIVALKKVRFDNLEPESVKFMAREILILRRLDHPNVIKLEGLVTSRMSCSLYLVFEYMEHDLAGLAASPDVKFTLPQIKCYMQQLLSGLEHCHDNNVLHRDIKGSNLLLDNNGILKIADFGLATFFDPRHKRPMTSRVVTLWLRAAAKAKGEAKRTRPRDRSHRAGPAPEANAEIQANLDRRRMITHANAKSKSEKFPPPHQDGAMGNPLGSCRHMEPMFEHQDASFSTVVPIEKGTSQTWSGPLFDPSALGQSRRKKQTTLDAKAAAYSKQLQKEKGGIRAR